MLARVRPGHQRIHQAADRAGITVDELSGLVDLGIVQPDADGRYRPGDVRRAGLVGSLIEAGIPLDGLADAIRDGLVSLDFLDAPRSSGSRRSPT